MQTNASFLVYRHNGDTGKAELWSSEHEKISIKSSAELMHFDIPGSRFGTTCNFVLLHDVEGQSMVLSIGTDKVRKAFDFSLPPLNPPLAVIYLRSCEWSQSTSPDKKTILIAVADHENGDTAASIVYQVQLPCPSLASDGEGNVQNSPFGDLAWTQSGNRISSRLINTLLCQFYGPASAYQIIAGVAANSLEGSHYIYTSETQNWTIVKFPQQVETIRSCVPANLPALGPGYLVLFQDNSAKRDVSCFFQGKATSKQIFLTGLDNPHRAYACPDKRGLTHIFVAADNGIGYIDHKKLNQGPEVPLPGISCSNVVVSESVVSSGKSVVLIYAISDHGELFVIEGTRLIDNNNLLEVPSSVALPIRTGIRNLTGMVNHLTGALDTIYTTNDNEQLMHLSRDPLTSLWKETEMVVKSEKPNAKIKTQAFLITIALRNSQGAPVPPGYTVQLSSAPTLAYINDRSYNITRRTQSVAVNQFGQLHIAIPVGNSLGASPIGLSFLPGSEETRVFNIQPSQHILTILSGFKDGDALKSAKTTDGRSLFSDAAAESHVEVPVGDDEEKPIVWQKDETGTSATEKSWVTKAVDATGEVLGDVIEFLKNAVKTVVKIALKVVGPVVRLILKIGAKVIRFTLNAISSIVTGLTYLIEGVFGIDLSSIRDFFTFRYKKVEATQKELAALIGNGLSLTSRCLHHNHDRLEQTIDIVGEFIASFISRPYSQGHQSDMKSSGGSILDNPIISNLLKFNPLRWIMEAITEEIGDDVQIPSLNINIGPQLLQTLKKQFDILFGFLKRSWSSFEAAIGQPNDVMEHLYNIFEDGFWTIFDSLKAIILEIYGLVMNSFDAIRSFCQGRWKIPFVTDLWEELTGTDFTLINFVSYIGAQILELPNLTSKPVLEGHGLANILNFEEKEIPTLFPAKLAKDIEAYGDSSLSLRSQLTATSTDQRQGAEYMATNPVKEPRFGLMANNSAEPVEAVKLPPPTSAMETLAIIRSAKTFTRVTSVALQGAFQGGAGGTDTKSLEDVEVKELNTSSTSTQVSDLSMTQEANSVVNPSIGVKSLAIGTNALGFTCRAVEQFILLNYYHDECRDAENFDSNCVETIASFIGLILSCFTDSPPLFALSNLVVSRGCFAASCMAPSGQLSRVSDVIGSGASALSSVLFLVKEPTCQTIPWVGVGSDVVCSCIQTGLMISRFANWNTQFSCCGNTSGTGPELRNPTKPRPPAIPTGGGDKGPEVESDDEEEKKPKRLVVTALQDERARALDRLVDDVIQELRNCPNGAIFDRDVIMNPGPQQNPESMCAVLRAIKGSVIAIVRGNDFAPAMTIYEMGQNFAFGALTANGGSF
ncbi:putative RNA-directed DNA polymerase from transposon X-element [Fusarium sp. NRRL 52700]|nr:putative RNA-directed DNA polymerase from transposon X-element [Fusarium sp. NRRL 52700]